MQVLTRLDGLTRKVQLYCLILVVFYNAEALVELPYQHPPVPRYCTVSTIFQISPRRRSCRELLPRQVRSQSRIRLLIHRPIVIRIPSRALVLPIRAQIKRAQNLALLLQELRPQPQLNMPSDMTVEQPRPGIIRQECQHQISLRRQHSHVPSGRVDVVQRGGIGEDPHPSAEHVEVVAVQVDGVWCAGCGPAGDLLDHPEGPGVGRREVDEV